MFFGVIGFDFGEEINLLLWVKEIFVWNEVEIWVFCQCFMFCDKVNGNL